MSITIVFVNKVRQESQTLRHSGVLEPGMTIPDRTIPLNLRPDAGPRVLPTPRPRADTLTVIFDCKRNRDILSQYL
jgi:hypothetical protein